MALVPGTKPHFSESASLSSLPPWYYVRYTYPYPVCLLIHLLICCLTTAYLSQFYILRCSSSVLIEMMERPYYMDYGSARLVIHKMVTSKYFDLAISAVIGLNVITMAMEFYMMPMVCRLCFYSCWFQLFRNLNLLWKFSTISSLGFS